MHGTWASHTRDQITLGLVLNLPMLLRRPNEVLGTAETSSRVALLRALQEMTEAYEKAGYSRKPAVISWPIFAAVVTATDGAFIEEMFDALVEDAEWAPVRDGTERLIEIYEKTIAPKGPYKLFNMLKDSKASDAAYRRVIGYCREHDVATDVAEKAIGKFRGNMTTSADDDSDLEDMVAPIQLGRPLRYAATQEGPKKRPAVSSSSEEEEDGSEEEESAEEEEASGEEEEEDDDSDGASVTAVSGDEDQDQDEDQDEDQEEEHSLPVEPRLRRKQWRPKTKGKQRAESTRESPVSRRNAKSSSGRVGADDERSASRKRQKILIDIQRQMNGMQRQILDLLEMDDAMA
jgi:cobalamin biosynthesis protein CobT